MVSFASDDPRVTAVRAEMARRGIAPQQLQPYEDPEFGHIDPMCDTDTGLEIRRFLASIWDDPTDILRHLAPGRDLDKSRS